MTGWQPHHTAPQHISVTDCLPIATMGCQLPGCIAIKLQIRSRAILACNADVDVCCCCCCRLATTHSNRRLLRLAAAVVAVLLLLLLQVALLLLLLCLLLLLLVECCCCRCQILFFPVIW